MDFDEDDEGDWTLMSMIGMWIKGSSIDLCQVRLNVRAIVARWCQ